MNPQRALGHSLHQRAYEQEGMMGRLGASAREAGLGSAYLVGGYDGHEDENGLRVWPSCYP
jgi:hypothetical protein